MSKFNQITGGYTPLMIASQQGNLQRVQSFLSKSDINSKNDTGLSALAISVKSGHFQIANFLMSNGADINSRNNSGQSVLFIASWYNQQQCVKQLISRKADLNIADQRGWTPLMISSYHSHTNIVKLLIQAGANPDLKDSFGKTAAYRSKQPQILDLLKGKIPVTKPEPKKPLQRSTSVNKGTPTNKKPDIYRGVKQTPDNMEKFKGQLDRHIQASTMTLACKAAQNCLSHIKKLVNSQIFKAYELLHQQVHQQLTDELERIYHNLGDRLVNMLEASCTQRGLSLPQDNFNMPSLQVAIQPRRGPPKLKPAAFGRLYDRVSKLTPAAIPKIGKGDLKQQLVDTIDRHIEDLASRLDIVSTQQIQEDVANKVSQLTRFLIQELENNLSYLSTQLYYQLQSLIENRFQQILAFNSGREPEPVTSSRVISSQRLPKLNLEGIK